MSIFALLLAKDAFSIILILVVFAFIFLVLTLIVGIVVFAFRRLKKHRAIWNSLAPKLNLTMQNPQKLEMKGIYNNCEIKLAVGVRGSGDSSETFTYCQTEFPQNLRFLLDIKTKYFLSNILDSNQITLGQADFDDKFNANCYDLNTLQRLLLSDFPSNKTQNLMSDLLLARQTFGIVNISDETVYIEKSGQIADENILKQMIDTTTYLANRFKSARESFPLADWEKDLMRNWQNIAQQNGLQFDSKQFILQGIYRNYPTQISLKTDKKIWQTTFRLKFQKSLMIGLKIMPENAIHQAMTWLGVQDIKSEIKEFDDAFIVKAQNVGFTKQLLQPQLCQQLLKLKLNSSDIQITDEEVFLTVNSVIGDQNLCKNYLDELIMVAQFLKP
ncbi:MAG: hypothetical protein MUC29_01830 [Pyrinomonadaceae bacterium]|jgi:hypothetical protein|nr:hypothetical protein [Pyrinomonadaceae bacterium]